MNKTQPSEDIIFWIKQHHKPLKESIRLLCQEKADKNEKIKALKDLIENLNLHAKAEEQALYENILEEERFKEMTLESFEEHSLAEILSHQFLSQDFENNWGPELAAKAVVFAEVVKHHIDEEETDLLPELRLMMSKDQLLDLGEIYRQIYANLKQDRTLNARSGVREKLEQAVGSVMAAHH